MTGPEKRIQDQCLDWLKEQGFYHLNTHGNAFEARGRPDILICVNGCFIGVELKKGILSVPEPLQLRHLRKIRESGGIAGWITSLNELKNLVNEAKHKEITHADSSV